MLCKGPNVQRNDAMLIEPLGITNTRQYGALSLEVTQERNETVSDRGHHQNFRRVLQESVWKELCS